MLLSKRADVRKFNKLLKAEEHTVIDLETTGLFAHRGAGILTVQFFLPYAKKTFTAYVAESETLFSVPQVELSWLDWDEINKTRIVMHNAKFDMQFLECAGIRIDEFRVYDTIHGVFLLNNLSESRALKRLTSDVEADSPEWLEWAPPELDLDLARETASKRADLSGVDIGALCAYGETDVVLTWILYKRQLKQAETLDKGTPWPLKAFNARESMLTRVVLDMEDRGLYWNDAEHRTIKQEMESRLIAMRQEFSFDPMSSNALKNVFGTDSYDEATLKQIGTPLAMQTIEYRKLQHDYSTFVVAVADCVSDDGILHPNLRLNGTNTGRFTANKPNVLGFPDFTRRQFGPRPGYDYFSSDLTQIELALGAWYADCTPMLETLEAGGDIHQTTADMVGVQRSIGKRLNFAMTYGVGAATMALQAGVSEAQAREWLQGFRKAYPEITKAKMKCEGVARRNGWVRLWNGHIRQVPEPHKAWSYLIQSGVGELAKDILLDLHEWVKTKGGFVVLHVHDEFIIEVPKGSTTIEELNAVITASGPEDLVYHTDTAIWGGGVFHG